MKIKKLEIQGFKSFADPVELNFRDGITGVVGPNGCGKSNIVDALRWVMGEQSAKHLRGGQMQDVIFNGSESRGPLGMAEVTLTLENDGKNVPAEYSHFEDIQVTRRLYRTGESEYEINRNGCRLRDITDLFLGTGVGTKAYSIIEQGRVGMIVSSKSEDRRQIIEEAAGITKYKARRQAAERRMAATRQNLERVSDVTQEMQKRINSLYRQAKKAERYKKLKTEIREVELHQASHRYFELMAKSGHETRTEAELNEKVVAEKEAISSLEQEVELARENLRDKEQGIGTIQGDIYESDNRLALSEQQIGHGLESIEAAKRREQQAYDETQRIAGQIELITSEKSSFDQDINNLAQGVAEKEEALAASQETLNKIQGRRDEFVQNIEAQKAEQMQFATKAASAQSHIQNLEHRKKDLAERHLRISAELIEANDNFAETDEHIKTVTQELASGKNQKQTDSERLQEIRTELEAQRLVMSEKEAVRLTLHEKLNQAQSRLHSIEEIADRYERSPEGVRAVMQKALPKEAEADENVYGLVADLLDVPKDLELPVEAALTRKLQAVVVNDAQTALHYARYLQQENQGRADFYVLQEHTPPAMEMPEHYKEWATPLLDEVKSRQPANELAAWVLGRTLLVRDADIALAHWEEAMDRGLILVTRKGKVFHEDGTLTGGVENQALTGLLAQKREIRELTTRVTRLQNQLDEAETERSSMSDTIDLLVQEENELLHRYNQLSLQIVAWEKDLHKHENDLQRFRSVKTERGADKDRLDHNLQVLDDEMSGQQATWSEALEKHDSLAQSVLETQEAMGNLEQDYEAQNTVVTDLRVQVAAIHERRENLQRSIAHHERSHNEFATRRDALSEQILESQKEAQGLSEEIEGVKASIEEEKEKRQALVVQLNEVKEAYETELSNVRAKESVYRERRQGIEGISDELHQVSMRLQETQIAMATLVERIQDRYQLALTEVLTDYQALPRLGKEATQHLTELRQTIHRMGEINLTAIDEYHEVKERYDFLTNQMDDLTHALAQLEKAIAKINRTTKKRFEEAFHAINENFQQVFPKLFRGGKAWLALTDPTDMLHTGVEIYAQPPGKKLGSVALMSGGEKALTAVSLIFSIFLIKPSPFCLLDEVDAPLDEANVGRFSDMVKSISSLSQFIVITHNKRTMEVVDNLYGITMEEPGISKSVNVNVKQQVAV
ncbi:MAG: chromosome segregation protein SMC [Myxococcales bacterium]|nr:chromosome segregation protein SMC [Myxococcales bacterium]